MILASKHSIKHRPLKVKKNLEFKNCKSKRKKKLIISDTDLPEGINTRESVDSLLLKNLSKVAIRKEDQKKRETLLYATRHSTQLKASNPHRVFNQLRVSKAISLWTLLKK